MSVYRSLVAGGPLLDYAGPVGIMTVIGATVGGLVGPLVGRALASRRRGRSVEEGDGSENGGETRAAGQPLWATLLVGIAVGYGIGTAWEQPVLGLLVGIGLALLAHRIFR